MPGEIEHTINFFDNFESSSKTINLNMLSRRPNQRFIKMYVKQDYKFFALPLES